MYHRIVASRVRSVFDQINAGNWEAMVDGLAPQFCYRFYGDHALGGERRTAAAMRRWWERASRLLPDLTFQVREVLVTGPPWATRVGVRLRVTGHLPDGEPYQNVVHQFVHLRWGRVTRIWTLEDTAVLRHNLDRVAASGVAEAHAPPIVDHPPPRGDHARLS